MKKIDEMDRHIILRAEALGYKTALLCLAGWTLYESWGTLAGSGTEPMNILPMLILMAVSCVRLFSEMLMKRKMVFGDEEYKAPNKILRGAVAVIVIVAIVLWIGSFLLMKCEEI